MTNSHKTQMLMEWNLFVSLIRDIKKIEYADWLALHNYNEPLANPRLLREIKLIVSELPHSQVSIFTNGDYLEPSTFSNLIDHGVAYVRVTLYPSYRETSKTPTVRRAFSWLTKKGLNKMATWKVQKARQGPSVITTIGGLHVEVICPEIKKYNWRGGTAPHLAGQLRQKPCYMTFHSASIDYQGHMKMCCNIFPEAADHQKYIIGSLKNSSFQELWGSSRMNELRSAHTVMNWNISPICIGCTQSLPLSDNEKNIYRSECLKENDWKSEKVRSKK